MTIDEAIKHCEEIADTCEFEASKYDMTDAYESHVASQEGECASEHRQLAKWLKELKSLKEKEEPRAVRYEGDGYADGEMVYDAAFCPNCEHEFEEDSENWECEFCPNCGQRLRWEE